MECHGRVGLGPTCLCSGGSVGMRVTTIPRLLWQRAPNHCRMPHPLPDRRQLRAGAKSRLQSRSLPAQSRRRRNPDASAEAAASTDSLACATPGSPTSDLRREVEVMRSLNHPNLCTLYEVRACGSVRGAAFLVGKQGVRACCILTCAAWLAALVLPGY